MAETKTMKELLLAMAIAQRNCMPSYAHMSITDKLDHAIKALRDEIDREAESVIHLPTLELLASALRKSSPEVAEYVLRVFRDMQQANDAALNTFLACLRGPGKGRRVPHHGSGPDNL